MLSSWFESIPAQLVLMVPLFAFLEACIGIGLFVSGVFLLTTCSLVYAQGDTSLLTLVSLAFSGALLGDHIGFFVGYKAGPFLWKKRWVRKMLVKRKSGFRKFKRGLLYSAPWAVCLGRLSPPIRSLSPLLVGAAGVKPERFFVYDLIACGLWATLLSLLLIGIDNI